MAGSCSCPGIALAMLPIALEPKSPAGSASAPFRNPVVWAVALLSGLAGVTSLATNTFLPSALKAVFHLDAVAAASVISTGFAWAIVLNLSFGFLMDRILRLNAWIKDYAARVNALYVDYYTPIADEKGWLKDGYSEDGLHPNAEGYKAMAAALDRKSVV